MFQGRVVQFDFQLALVYVDVNRVAFVQGRDGTAEGSFGRNVADHQAACSAAETAVGKEGDRVPQAFADDGSGDAQHFAHARTTFRSFVADDDHVACLDLLGSYRGHRV